MKKLLLTLLAALSIVTANYVYAESANENSSSISEQSADKSDAIIASAFSNHQSN